MSKPILREMSAADLDFIFHSWLESYWGGCIKHLMVINQHWYYTNQHELIERLLKPGKVIIACIDDDPFTIIGWVCFAPGKGTVHYVYVKNAFRKMGIAKLMMPFHVEQITHITQTAREILEDKWIETGKRPIFNPWFLTQERI